MDKQVYLEIMKKIIARGNILGSKEEQRNKGKNNKAHIFKTIAKCLIADMISTVDT